MKNNKLWLLIAIALVLSLSFAIAVGCDDDDDDDDDADDDDFSDDDDSADDDDDDVADDDDAADDDDDATDDDDDDDWDFYYTDVQGMVPIGNAVYYAPDFQGHEILAAMAIINVDLTTLKQDAVEWDMLDGAVGVGNHTFDIPEGTDITGNENPTIMAIFGLSLTGNADAAYVGVSGDAVVEATGITGDTFTGHVSNVEMRPFNLTTGAIDWSGPKGFIENFACDTVIQDLPGT